MALVLATIAEIVSGPRQPGLWASMAGIAGLLAVVAVSVARSIGPEERDLIERAGRRILPPLPRPPDAEPTPVRLALRPGRLTARRLRDRPDLGWLVVTPDGLEIPTWAIDGRPRPVGRLDTVTVAWHDIERWRVRTDSDGPDLHVLRTARPWFDGRTAKRWPTLDIRRRVVLDESALLLVVRTVGQLAVEMEPEPAGRRRPRSDRGS